MMVGKFQLFDEAIDRVCRDWGEVLRHGVPSRLLRLGRDAVLPSLAATEGIAIAPPQAPRKASRRLEGRLSPVSRSLRHSGPLYPVMISSLAGVPLPPVIV